MITTCPARRAGARACSLCRPRRPTGRWSPPRPSSRPSHRGRSKPRASCSCRGCAAPKGARARPLGRIRSVKGRKRGMQPHLVHENQPRGKTSPEGSTCAATITRQAALRNSSRSVALGPPFCASNRSWRWRGTWSSGSPKPRLWPPPTRSAPSAWRTGAPLGPLRGAC
jgi:hypothetical protein